MTMFADLLAFTATAALLTITPGLDTALVLRTLAAEGPRPAFLAACGIGLGCLAWGAIAALGLGALLAASTLAYETLRWAGAAYLLYLGGRLLLHPRRAGLVSAAPETRGEGGRRWFARGFLTNILNPKVGIFYISFLPQFIPAHAPVAALALLMAAIHVLLGLGWFALLIAASRPLRRALERPSVVAVLDRLTGIVFLGFGVRLALSQRG